MTIKDLIYTEIDKLEEETLNELYEIVKHFAHVQPARTKTGALKKLKRIKIQAPEDFAANFDLYLSGEKQFVSNPDLR